MADRYDRQKRDPRWDQQKLTNATALVFGSGVMATHTLINMVALGVGNIYVYGNQRIEPKESRNPHEILLSEGNPGDSKVEVLEQKMLEMNPLVNIKGIHWDVDRPYFLDPVLPPRIDVIINAENDPQNELILYEFGKANKIPVLNIDCAANLGKFTSLLADQEIAEWMMATVEYDSEDPFTSAFLASILVDEERKIHHPLSPDEEVLSLPFYYNELSDSLFGIGAVPRTNDKVKSSLEEFRRSAKEFYKNLVVAVVGAGSLGVPVMQGCAEKGVGTLINVDTDIAEEVNLNRQYLHYRSVGMKKVHSLASELEALFPETEYVPLDAWFSEDFAYQGKKPDLIYDCVDSFESRRAINSYATKNSVKVISGGTSFSTGRVVMYDPGRTLCMDCLLGINKSAADEREVTSCVEVKQASVIISNRIIAAMMVNSMDLMFAGHPFNGVMSYDSNSPMRIARNPVYEICDCHKR